MSSYLFGGHLHERLAIRIVDVADRREVEASERLQVRQIGSIKIDAIETNPDENGRCDYCTKDKPSGGLDPAKRGVAVTAERAPARA
jgi:hypothetical protein